MKKLKTFYRQHQAECDLVGSVIGAIVAVALFLLLFHLAAAIAPNAMYRG